MKEHIFNKHNLFTLGKALLSLSIGLVARFALLPIETYGFGLYLGFSIVAWLIAGYDLLLEIVESIKEREDIIGEALLMTLASLGAFLLPLLSGEMDPIFDAVLVVVLYQIGELFEDVASERSKNAIKDALLLKTNIAHLVKNDQEIDIKPEELKIGDKINIRVGESVPSDGKVIKGDGSVDMSSLTGEFNPVHKTVGDEIPNGTILKSGSLQIEVTKEYKDSTVQKVLDLVTNSMDEKSKTEKFINKFAKYYTPVVFVLAILVGVIPPLFLGINSWEVWASYIQVGLSFLVISCPCAIIIAIPLIYFAGLGVASKHGVIVKGSSYLDTLREVTKVVTDKTGTLTYGRFAVETVYSVNNDKKTLRHDLAISEMKSNHPIAVALRQGLKVDDNDIEDYEEIAGKGVRAVYQKHTFLAGTKAFLEENGVEVTKVPENSTGTIIYLAKDKAYQGYAILKDEIKKESYAFIEGLKKLNIKSLILTGDKKASAEEVKNKLGVDEVKAELLPDQKRELLRQEIDKKQGKVAYLGDGINDAPSLALADVGVSMGSFGSDAAIEASDVVIMNDNPAQLVTAIKVGKSAHRRALGALIISLGIKLVVMILSLIFKENFPLWVAVLSDTGLAAVMVVYALSFLLKRKI